MKSKNELIEIYSGKFWQFSMIKDLLEDNGIPTIIENEQMSIIDPNFVLYGGVATVNIKVRVNDFVRAKELIDEFTNAGFSLEEDDE